MNPCIAIIDRNSLSANALEELLQDMFPMLEIISFHSLKEFLNDCDRFFVHYFISEDILLSSPGDFDTLKKETIVLCQGPGKSVSEAGFKVVNIFQSEKEIVSAILHLHEHGRHGTGHPGGELESDKNRTELLSSREKEVLSLMVRGFYNKEIADKLNISVTTAIFHRNNICTKLGTRSIGRLAIYAILSNLVKIDEI